MPGNGSSRTGPDLGQFSRVGWQYLTNRRRGEIRRTQLGSGCSHIGPDETQRFPSRLCGAEKTNCGTTIEPLMLTRFPATGNREGPVLAAPSCRAENILTGVVWCRLIRESVGVTAHRPRPAKEGHLPQPAEAASVTLLKTRWQDCFSLPQKRQRVNRGQMQRQRHIGRVRGHGGRAPSATRGDATVVVGRRHGLSARVVASSTPPTPAGRRGSRPPWRG